jgi:hypothetical protein
MELTHKPDFKSNHDDIEIGENRRMFNEWFHIKKRYEIPMRDKTFLGIDQGQHQWVAIHPYIDMSQYQEIDHMEKYITDIGEKIIISSPYHPSKPHPPHWDKICKLYDQGVETYMIRYIGTGKNIQIIDNTKFLEHLKYMQNGLGYEEAKNEFYNHLEKV